MEETGRSAGSALGDYAYKANTRERSMSEVLKDIFGNVQEMVRSEIRLARAEIREETGKAADSVKLLAIGAGLALFAASFFLVSVMLILALVLPTWAASLAMAVVLGIPGFMLISSGRKHLKIPTPQKTIDNVKENVEWMKNQTK
ncbi:MAG: phage holin family protein [Bryobacteraceae bacterium]|nr:phage holin family protein [Bryobacteraceae bacterium]